MNILVVEDEPLALDDLLTMLAPLAAVHQIVGCDSGVTALAAADQRWPDLVITDIRMSGIDGLELVRRLKARRSDFAALVLSGHSEFEYARESMRLGIADYLLKPVRTDALLQTVAAALATLSNERAQLSQLREARLVRLLLAGPRTASASLDLLTGRWGLIVSVCENWESPVVWRDTAVARETMAGCVEQHGLAPCDVVGIDGHIRVCLAPLAGAASHALETAALSMHRSVVARGLCAHTTFAVKSADENPALVLAEALRRLGQGLRFARATFVRPAASDDGASPSIREQLVLVERALAEGRPAQVADHIQSALAQLEQGGATQEHVAEVLDRLFTPIREQLRPEQADVLPQRSALVGLLRRIRSYAELARWVDLQLQPLLTAQRGVTTPRQLVRALVAQVHARYADDISLQTYAAEHGVSLAYFSRLFKDEVGITFSDYLTNVRMEKAKELLARGDLRLAEISGLVGYEDPKYFGQIFRRAAGMSPLDYQRSHQQTL